MEVTERMRMEREGVFVVKLNTMYVCKKLNAKRKQAVQDLASRHTPTEVDGYVVLR